MATTSYAASNFHEKSNWPDWAGALKIPLSIKYNTKIMCVGDFDKEESLWMHSRWCTSWCVRLCIWPSSSSFHIGFGWYLQIRLLYIRVRDDQTVVQSPLHERMNVTWAIYPRHINRISDVVVYIFAEILPGFGWSDDWCVPDHRKVTECWMFFFW